MKSVLLEHLNCREKRILICEKGICIFLNKENEKVFVYYSNAYKDNFGVCVFSYSFRVGIDIEKIENIKKIIYKSDFYPQIIDTAKYSYAKSTEFSTVLWCLHEAVGKLEGTGFAKHYRIEQILHSTVRYNCGETNKSANYKAFIGKVYAFVLVYNKI